MPGFPVHFLHLIYLFILSLLEDFRWIYVFIHCCWSKNKISLFFFRFGNFFMLISGISGCLLVIWYVPANQQLGEMSFNQDCSLFVFPLWEGEKQPPGWNLPFSVTHNTFTNFFLLLRTIWFLKKFILMNVHFPTFTCRVVLRTLLVQNCWCEMSVLFISAPGILLVVSQDLKCSRGAVFPSHGKNMLNSSAHGKHWLVSFGNSNYHKQGSVRLMSGAVCAFCLLLRAALSI